MQLINKYLTYNANYTNTNIKATTIKLNNDINVNKNYYELLMNLKKERKSYLNNNN